MLVNVNGEWVSVPDDLPQELPWDETLQANPTAASQDNRGCPPGYFCQYVSAAKWWNPFYTVGEDAAYTRVCRRLDEAIATDPSIGSAESGEGLWEASVENIAAAAQVPVDAAKAALPYVAVGFGSTTALLIAGGLAYLYLISPKGGKLL